MPLVRVSNGGSSSESWLQFNDGSGIGCYYASNNGDHDYKYTTSASVTVESELLRNTFWWASNLSAYVKKDIKACWMGGDVVLASGRSFPPRVFVDVQAGDTIVSRTGNTSITVCEA